MGNLECKIPVLLISGFLCWGFEFGAEMDFGMGK